MRKLLDIKLLEDIAIELGVNPSFIEKDWFAVQILKAISSIPDINIIFTGGTSLSKGYGLIKRFSEDLDFRIGNSSNLNKTKRKTIRNDILCKLREVNEINLLEKSLQKHNSSKFFSINVEYPQSYKPIDSLRPHLKLEFSFDDTILPIEPKPIQSFITEFTTQTDTDCIVNTISPIETAADKFSALLWRVDVKDRTLEINSLQNDPTIIRHLHDLSALEDLILKNDSFVEMVNLSFEKDRGRSGFERQKSIKELANATLMKLKEEPLYKKEYIQFVDAMSYAIEDEKITFDIALNSFEVIVGLF